MYSLRSGSFPSMVRTDFEQIRIVELNEHLYFQAIS